MLSSGAAEAGYRPIDAAAAHAADGWPKGELGRPSKDSGRNTN